MKAPINKIIPQSSVDGPGNRTTIFFQGCNLDCLYCHNPETMRLCRQCGSCIGHCPSKALARTSGKIFWRQELCIGCDQCISACPENASPRVQWVSPEQLAKQVLAGTPFIRGVTCSGGECMLYADFLRALFEHLKLRKLNCMIDSNGSVSFEKETALMELCDGVLLDVKAVDADAHRRLTSADNATILKNAQWLARHGKLAELRTVVMAGDPFGAMRTVDMLTRELSRYLDYGPIHYRIITFRPYGVREQYRNLGQPDEALLQAIKEKAHANGFTRVTIT